MSAQVPFGLDRVRVQGFRSAVDVSFVAVVDRDAPRGREPAPSARALNREIVGLVGPERAIMLAPDFEGVSQLRGHTHKAERAWRRFKSLPPDGIPPPLVDAVRRVLSLAREEG